LPLPLRTGQTSFPKQGLQEAKRGRFAYTRIMLPTDAILILLRASVRFELWSGIGLLKISRRPNVINCFALRFVKGPGNHLCEETEQDTHHRDHESDHGDEG